MQKSHIKVSIAKVAEPVMDWLKPSNALTWAAALLLIASSYAYSQAVDPETHILERGAPLTVNAGSRDISVTWTDENTLALDPTWADFSDPALYFLMKLPPRVRTSLDGNFLNGDFQEIDGTWQRYFSLPWDDGTDTSAPAAITRSRTKAATPPAPSLINGDFSAIGAGEWVNRPNNKDYLGGGFNYKLTTAAGWTAYAGNGLEVWSGGDGQGSFIELDAAKGSYGIKQPIQNAAPGEYILLWKELGRNNPASNTNKYHVKIYHGTAPNEVVIAKLTPSRNAYATAWNQTAFVFKITKDQFAKAAGAPIQVALIPDDNNAYGCLIDDVKLLPVDIKVVRAGMSAAPVGGLVVEKTDLVRYRISPNIPDHPGLLYDSIQWHWRYLKFDGTYSAWTAFKTGKGHTFVAYPKDAGIYEIKFVANEQDYIFQRKFDAPNADNSKGYVQAIHKKGAHDCLGVVEEDWQIRLRKAAWGNLGSTRWNQKDSIYIPGHLIRYGKRTDKCNLFVFEQGYMANTTIPLNGTAPKWPPIAFDWWNDNTGRTDSKGRIMISQAIAGWQRMSDRTRPQPGLVVSRPNLAGIPGKYGSHVGILDYDGSWISAGPLKVNKYYHPSSMEADAVGHPTTAPYQPQAYRKYVGSP